VYVLGLFRSSVPAPDEAELNALCPCILTLVAAFVCEATSEGEVKRRLEIGRVYSPEDLVEVQAALELLSTNCDVVLANKLARRLLLPVNIFRF
jgi:hypothetical protein